MRLKALAYLLQNIAHQQSLGKFKETLEGTVYNYKKGYILKDGIKFNHKHLEILKIKDL